MRQAIFILLLLSLSAHGQTEGDCSGNTIEIEQCMQTNMQKVESELNAVYIRAIRDLSAPDEPFLPRSRAQKALREAQRAWVTFRKKNCDAVYTLNSGGTIRGMRYVACMKRHAEARIKEIKMEYLNESE
jgi:uncharacterized protein YecT (DUF1311 family)